MSCLSTSPPACGTNSNCPSLDGCPPNQCPDLEIKRHDMLPPFKVAVEDESGPIDLTGLVLEASMWAKAKLKRDITASDTYIQLADNIGFNQVLVNDIIIIDRIRSPEYMVVIGFDEEGKRINVSRGYNGTTPASSKKGTPIRMFR